MSDVERRNAQSAAQKLEWPAECEWLSERERDTPPRTRIDPVAQLSRTGTVTQVREPHPPDRTLKDRE